VDNVTAAAYKSKISEEKIKTQGKVTQFDNSRAVSEQNIPTNAEHAHYRPTTTVGGLRWSIEHAQLANNEINGNVVGLGLPDGFGILTGVEGKHDGNNPNQHKYTKLAMSAIPAESLHINKWKYHNIGDSSNKIRLDVAGWQDNFYDTDLLFEMVIKSIVAKVFAIVDAYRLFHRPTVDRRASYSLNPLRMILGGNDGSVEGGALLPNVKIIKEAVEFYFRIILLAEWYREQYGFNSNRQENADSWRLSIVPTVDGIWSDFIDVIFSKAEYVKEGNYSETQVQKLILAMNDIWKSYKSRFPKSTVSSIINAFVLEMNRIFGFMKQKEIDAYITDRRSFLENSGHGNYDENDKENFIDYDILNAKDQFGERLAPSAKFVNVNVKKNIANKQRNMVFLQEEIDKIKKKIDVDFINATRGEGDKNYSFQNTLKIYKSEVEHAKNDSDSYKVVLRMIQGANKYISLNSDKLIMVHEMVAAPLVCLYGVYKVLARYNAFLHGCSLKNIEKWSENRNGKVVAVAGKLATVADARAAYKAQIALLYPKTKTDSLIHELFTRSFLGNEHGEYHTGPYAEGAQITQSGYMWVGVGGAVLAAGGGGVATVLADVNTGIVDGKVNAVGLMRDLLAAVIDLAANQSKLVTCSVAANNINMDWSALEDLCISTLAQVKDNIKKLRNMFDPSTADIVDKYEDRLLVGSTRWLEENLIEVLFKDRDECGLQRAHTEHLRYTFDKLSKAKTNKTATAAGQLIHDQNARYGSVAGALRELIYYGLNGDKFAACSRSCNFKDFPFNVIGTNRAATADEAKNLMDGKMNIINSLMPVPNLLFEQPIRCSDMHTLLVGRDDAVRSMFFAFNRILYSYLYTNFDDNSAKIYAPLIEGFANSAASYEILQGKAYCNATMLRIDYDIALQHNQHTLSYMEDNNLTGKNYDIGGKTPLSPDPASIIWLSNAVTIRSLLTTSVTLGTSQKKKFLFDNLADIPEFIKERMRVNLPLFSKLLSDFYDRVILLKSIIGNTVISENIMHPTIAAANETDFENPVVVDVSSRLALSAKDSGYMKEYLSTMLTKMAELGAALRKSADGVYRELQDKPPHFFETGKDFLLDYRNRFGGLPLMPVSSILAPLKCMDGKVGRLSGAGHNIAGGAAPQSFAVKSETDFGSTNLGYVLLPVKENGSNVYKFNYATRSILAQNIEPTMEHFPGAKEIYNAYASNTNKNVTLTPQEYADTIKKMVKLGKFLIDGAVYSRLYNQLDSMGLSVPKKITTHDEYDSANNSGLTGTLVPAGKMRDAGAGYAVNPVVTDYATRGVFNALAWKDSNNLPGDLAEVLIKVRDKLGHVANINLGQVANSLFVNGAGDLLPNIAHVALGLPMENKDSNLIGKTAEQISGNAANTAIVRDFRSYLSDYLHITKNETLAAAQTAAEIAQLTELLHQSLERIYVDDPHTLPRSRADNTRAEYLKNRLRRNMSILPLSDPLGLAGIIELTENTDIKVSKERLATALGTSISEFKDRKREDLRVFNILDMNIVPINVHAFMREVPFVNLLNYSYTFDRMVHDFILPNYISKKVDTGNTSSLTTDNIIIAANDEVASTRELLVKLLVHPYAKLSDNGLEYFALAASLFNGNDNLKLGRPRYLSDQLWHKVLMTSSAQLVAGQEMYNNPGSTLDNRYGKMASLESGPQAYEAIRSVVANGMPFMNRTQRNDVSVTFKNLENMLAAVLVACNNRQALIVGVGGNDVRNTLIPLMVLAQSDHKVMPITPLGKNPQHVAGKHAVYTDPPTPGVIALSGGGAARLSPDNLFAAGQSLANDNADAYLPNLVAIVGAAKNNLLLSPVRDKVAIKLIDQLADRAADANFYQNTGAQDAVLFVAYATAANFVVGHMRALITACRAGAINLAALAPIVTGNIFNNAAIDLQTNLMAFSDRIVIAAGAVNAGNCVGLRATAVGKFQDLSAVAADITGDAAIGNAGALSGLVQMLGALRTTQQQFDIDTAGTYFSGKQHAAGVAGAGGYTNAVSYHYLSIIIDTIPYLTDFTRVILKAVAVSSMHVGSTITQILNWLREASVDQTTLQKSLFDRFMLECIIKTLDVANGPNAEEDALHTSIVTAILIARSAAYVLINEIELFNTTGRVNMNDGLPSVLVLATNPVATPGLKIIKSNEYKENTWSAVNDNAGNNNNMAVGDVLYCAELGKMRFDTKLVRNLTWMVNLQRIMRVIMVNHLSHLNTPVIRGLKIANPKVTEFEANEKFEESDFNGEDYAAI
jgi:hypothetical protein